MEENAFYGDNRIWKSNETNEGYSRIKLHIQNLPTGARLLRGLDNSYI